MREVRSHEANGRHGPLEQRAQSDPSTDDEGDEEECQEHDGRAGDADHLVESPPTAAPSQPPA